MPSLEEKVDANTEAILGLNASFEKFKENDFDHLDKKVVNQGKSLTFIKGQLYVVIPLVIAILGLVIVFCR